MKPHLLLFSSLVLFLSLVAGKVAETPAEDVVAQPPSSKTPEKHEFQAEVTRLMDIIINSLYTQREVFLRELISNAADALEKARFHSLKDDTFLGNVTTLDIRLEFDKEAKTLSITDTGIGMSKQDLINNLGTVAKSGTSNFLEGLSQGADVNLIGQFGVGFYSAFLVADKTVVVSKSINDAQHVWESSASSSFSIVEDPLGDTLGRGTRITLHLKEDATDLLNEFKLKDLVSKFSQFVAFPILIKVEKTVTEEVPIEEETEKKDDDVDVDVKDDEDDKDKKEDKPKTKKVDKKVKEWELINTEKAIWLRAKEDVSDKEYTSFYKAISKDWADPLTHIHFTAEGEIELKALLYIPSRAPSDMFDNYFNKQNSVKLYVRRVLVADQFDDLLPKYLHFAKGVVDSDDLPLNVSREQLQQHKIMKVITKKLVRKLLELIRKMSNESDKRKEDLQTRYEEEQDEEKKKELDKERKEGTTFEKFWKEFSRNMKLGCYEDDTNRSKVAKILKFHTSRSSDKQISLDKYVQNMAKDQNSIYYAAGESIEQLMKLPQMQMFAKKNVEVLFLIESMDEPCVQKLADYDGKKFVSIQKGDVALELTPDEIKRENKLKKMYEPLTNWWKDELSGKVQKVEVSRRLVNDPCAVVASQWGYSAQMEKIMKTQTFADSSQVKMMAGMKILEINPNHQVISFLLDLVKSDKKESAKKIGVRLYQAAMLASGFDIENPTEIASVVYRSVAKDLGVDPDVEVKEIDVGSLDDDDTPAPVDEAPDDDVEDDEDLKADDEGAKAEVKVQDADGDAKGESKKDTKDEL